MYKEIANLKVCRKSAYFFLAAALFSLFTVFCANLRTAYPMQDDLRKTVYGSKQRKPQPKSQPIKQINNPNIRKSKLVIPENPDAPKKATFVKKVLPIRSRRALVNVTFTAQQPNLEIWLNDKNVGLTDKDAKFSKKLAPNIYRVAVKKDNQIAFPVKTINVTAEQTEFKLFTETVVRKTPEVKPAAPVEEERKRSDEEIAEETAAKIKEILENYADPSKTDTVSTEDWKLVLQAVQLGQLQGFTAVQIEAQRWFASGEIELAKQDYTSAFTAFTKAVEFMPKSALPFYGLGKAYIGDNQPVQALKAFQRAAQLEPKMAMLYKGIGDAQRLLKNKKEAILAYRNAIQLGYTTPETRRLLGVMLLDTERNKEALEQLEELAESAPTAELYVAIGDGYQKLKREFSAIEFYRKSIEIDPNLAVAYFKLGDSLLNQREYSKAKEVLEKALELDPNGKTFNRQEARKKVREAASKIK